jgi:hypothetical protein
VRKNTFRSVASNIHGVSRRIRVSCVWSIFVCAVYLCASLHLFAQFDAAQINGTIRDQSGALIPNAKIQIENRDTGLVRQTLTNSTGTYVLSQIPPGVYNIKATA